jgi:hypothetical protein
MFRMLMLSPHPDDVELACRATIASCAAGAWRSTLPSARVKAI